MDLDTRLAGDPEAIRGAARWLRDDLGGALDGAIDAIYAARRLADGGWDGAASDKFRRCLTADATSAERLADVVAECARQMDDLAAQLQRAQSDLAAARDAAREAGLRVDGWVIRDPGVAPPEPGPLLGDASPSVVRKHADSVLAGERHMVLVAAYKVAEAAVLAARQMWTLAVEVYRNVWLEISTKPVFFLANVGSGTVGALAALNTDTLRKHAEFLAGESQKFLDLARSAPAGTPAAVIYRDMDTARVFTTSTDDALAAATRSDAVARASGIKLGGVLAAASVAYDVLVTDKPVGQAVVSGTAGFGASLAAGMLAGGIAGSLLPVFGTGVGIVAGGTAGAVAGLFTSGAVDAMYTHGTGDVGGAISAGFEAVHNTGVAVGEVVEEAWDEIFGE